MQQLSVIELLESNGITATPVRILIYKTFQNASEPLSLMDIERILGSVDKSTVSRTLATFKKHRILHYFNDGSGSVKYEICNHISSDDDRHDDLHAHFRCEKCGSTFCLTSVKVPEVVIPEGFLVKESNYLITGLCPNCQS